MQKKLLRFYEIKVYFIEILSRNSDALSIKRRVEVGYKQLKSKEARTNARTIFGRCS